MKNWKPAYKVAAISCGSIVFIGVICGAANAADGFGFALGLVCLAGGVLNLLIAFISFLASSKQLTKGLLLSAGILLLLSGISCGTALASTNF